MNTNLLEGEVNLVSFYGGHKRGKCYQVTEQNGRYVQLTIPQINAILKALADSDFDIGWAWRSKD
jgi:hypothetical protein